VSDRVTLPDDLILLLERLLVQSAGVKSTPDVTREQVDVLITRIAALTDALRGAAEDNTAKIASRMLIADLAAVTAQFRGRANELSEVLTRALDNLRKELDDAEQSESKGNIGALDEP